ncbi:MAG: tRNA (cytidine(34)-2'-O)-methyltransferase [Pirellulaceae bacterium]
MTETKPWLNIVLHQPEIPGNTGAVGRTCVALGAKLWLVRPLGFRIDEKTLRRAGLDYWQYLNWEVVDHWEHLRNRLEGHRMWMLTKTAQNSMFECEFKKGDVLVFGSETAGLPPSLLAEHSRYQLRIPTTDNVRSLNLASSVAVSAYEAFRQIAPDL